MTSRISFSKLWREEIKHQLVSIFVVILLFLIELLSFYFNVQNALRLNNDYTQVRIENISSPDFEAFFPTMIMAVLLAASCFSYLYSRKKTDFYMSLPIKRNEQFLMGIMVSAVIFLIPCVITTIMEAGIVLTTGYMSSLILQSIFWRFVCRCLAFAATWVTMTLSVIMTGHLVVAFMGFGIFCAYVPLLLYEIYPTFAELFYETFVHVGMEETPWYFFSPVSLISGLSGNYNWSPEKFRIYLIAIVIFVVAVGLISWILYKKRPAEAAGKAMAFDKANSVIRFMIVAPLALYFGYFLEKMSMTESGLWLIIGTIIGAILFHGIMESIYDFDLKNMLAKKKQLAATIGVCLCVLAGFYFTADMYNAYIPERAEVENVKLTIYDRNVYFYDIGDGKGIQGETVDKVLALAERMILQNTDMLEADAEQNGYSLGSVTIEYRMKDGKEKGRIYSIYTDNAENRDLLDQIVATEDFKDDYFTIYNVPNEVVQKITLDNSFESEEVWLSEEEQAEFLDIYRKELTEMTLTEMEEDERYAQLNLKYEYEYEHGVTSREDNCFIYESFDETIAFLETHDITVENPLEHCDIISIELQEEYDEQGNPLYVIEDQEVLTALKDKFVLADLYGQGYVDGPRDSHYAFAEVKIGNRIDHRNIYIKETEIAILKKAAK